MMGLQEAQFFHDSRKLLSGDGWHFERSSCRKAALLWKGPWKSQLRAVQRGHRFVIAWFRAAAIVCLYLPHADEKDEEVREFGEVLEEVTGRIREYSRLHPAQPESIILFADANVEMSACWPPIMSRQLTLGQARMRTSLDYEYNSGTNEQSSQRRRAIG